MALYIHLARIPILGFLRINHTLIDYLLHIRYGDIYYYFLIRKECEPQALLKQMLDEDIPWDMCIAGIM